MNCNCGQPVADEDSSLCEYCIEANREYERFERARDRAIDKLVSEWKDGDRTIRQMPRGLR